METTDLALILEFQHRLRKLADTSGYAFVYDALSLIREYIPYWEIGIDIIKPTSEDPNSFRPGCNFLWIATRWTGRMDEIFTNLVMLMNISHIKNCAQDVIRRLIAGDPIVPHSLAEEAQRKPGLLDYFYKEIMRVSDVVDMTGLLGHYQLLESPCTRNLYVTFVSVLRDGGETFDQREKQLIAIFFNSFVDHFRPKLACTDPHRFLPIFTDLGLKPRDLATIKACFDLRLRGETVSRAAVAGILGRSEDNVDDSIKRIRKAALKDFEPGTEEYRALYKEFGLAHFADVFKTYAYFGFYPPTYAAGTNLRGRFNSHLSEQLDKLR